MPEAVRNYLCLLGWSPKDNREKIPIDEIVQIFDLNKVVRRHATFDPDKLHWLNGEYARELPDDRFHQLARQCFADAVDVKLENFSEDYIRAALETCKGKINTFDELASLLRVLFRR